jgi:GNAT superfamily N-acetyltransferase
MKMIVNKRMPPGLALAGPPMWGLWVSTMIREFAPDDQSQVIDLQEEFMAEFFPEFLDDQRKYEWNADVYSIDEHYISKGGEVWVVEADANIIGFGCLRLKNSSTAEIKRVWINHRHRGNGLGKSIIKQIEDYCASSSITKVLVDTDDRFEVAKSMYLGMGYIACRSETEIKDGREYTDHYYEKILQQAWQTHAAGAPDRCVLCRPSNAGVIMTISTQDQRGRAALLILASGEWGDFYMAESDQYSGGCFCGAIRYQVSGPPAMVAYCHCDDCRKSGGSVVAALAGFRRDGFEIVNGNPASFGATPAVKRSFCNTCGSPLFYENQDFPENIYIHIGGFDQAEELPPDRHTWVSHRISWHEIHDNLAQYEKLSNAGLPGNTPPYAKPGRTWLLAAE